MDGCFYWYDNNWHYLRKWDHFKQLKSVASLPLHLQKSCPDYSKAHLPQSDRIMSRTLSLQIKLSWTPEELQKRVEIIEKVMKEA